MWAAGLIAMLLAICFPMRVGAQAKPKRDVSKDRVERPKKKSKPQRHTQPAIIETAPVTSKVDVSPKTKPEKRVTRPKKNPQREKKPSSTTAPVIVGPTFLTVNNQKELSRSYSYEGAKEKFEVNCDDSDWIVAALPLWCSAQKSGPFFTLTCHPSRLHEPRKCKFTVRNGSHYAEIEVVQEARPGEGGISSFMMWHNERSYSIQGRSDCILTNRVLKIRVYGTVKEPLDKKWAVVAVFQYPNGEYVKVNTKYPYYKNYGRTDNGQLFGLVDFNPQDYKNGNFDVTIEVPNDAFSLDAGPKYDITCKLMLLCESCDVKLNTKTPQMSFKAWNKKGKVKTR